VVSMQRRQFLQVLAVAPAVVLLPAAAVTDSRPNSPARPMKSNDLPVYAHYMPWFATPETTPDGSWGWHWAMDRCDPDVVDPRTGRRDIAAHYYPLIGPYDSSDRDALEYHLLLMKLSGIDGVLVDWYGASSSDDEARMLLRNADAVIERAEALGLRVGVVLEELFADGVDDLRSDLAYLSNHYLNRSSYIRTETGPLLPIFGPRKIRRPEEWAAILGPATDRLDVRTLWKNEAAGEQADGHFLWPYQERPGDHLDGMRRYYDESVKLGAEVMGVAYPGFEDYYAQGADGGQSLFVIPPEGGSTLDRVLDLVDDYSPVIDMLQLATWNDFGEGTMFEPTAETGFTYLSRLQTFTGVTYVEDDLRLVLRLHTLRKQTAGDADAARRLDDAVVALAELRLSDARQALDAVTGTGSDGRSPGG
jgi:hypothetical protein